MSLDGVRKDIAYLVVDRLAKYEEPAVIFRIPSQAGAV